MCGMKIRIKKINPTHNNLCGGINTSYKNFMRICGYIEIFNPHKNNDVSYARSFDSGHFYPRFHIYIQDLPTQETEINLHLDMKKASYEGVSAHSGEYDGELVSREAKRIKNISDKFSLEKTVQHQPLGFKKKTSFWRKIFGF
ncbi:hypothetical protein KJ671_02535 [Patescibacteria group bacterium]|nr:hypothetical protein [Patescibacteria group bacterium]